MLHSPQTLIPSSTSTTPSAQIAPPARQAWCFIPRKPLFLRLEAPRPRPKWPRRRDRRGASSPANPYSFVSRHHALSPNASPDATGVVLHPPATPYSFVPKHHALNPNASPGATGVVLHPPQTLIPSSRSTTPLSQTAPPAGSAWCLTDRTPLFRRAEPLQLPPPPKTGQVPFAGLPQTQPAQFVEMK